MKLILYWKKIVSRVNFLLISNIQPKNERLEYYSQWILITTVLLFFTDRFIVFVLIYNVMKGGSGELLIS